MTASTLFERYHQEVKSALQDSLGVANVHQVPRLHKIAVNVGIGDIKGNEPLQKSIEETLSLITGQKPVKTKAKRAIAGFKLRAGDVIGYQVTLRGPRMYQFLDRLITYVFPRIRDFQGFPTKGFDGRGSYSFGLKEQAVFPELPYHANDKSWGLQVTVVTSAADQHGTSELLTKLGFPFAKAPAPKAGK